MRSAKAHEVPARRPDGRVAVSTRVRARSRRCGNYGDGGESRGDDESDHDPALDTHSPRSFSPCASASTSCSRSQCSSGWLKTRPGHSHCEPLPGRRPARRQPIASTTAVTATLLQTRFGLERTHHHLQDDEGVDPVSWTPSVWPAWAGQEGCVHSTTASRVSAGVPAGGRRAGAARAAGRARRSHTSSVSRRSRCAAGSAGHR
jgi:hypothetical protein